MSNYTMCSRDVDKPSKFDVKLEPIFVTAALAQRFSTQTTPRPVFEEKKFPRPTTEDSFTKVASYYDNLNLDFVVVVIGKHVIIFST